MKRIFIVSISVFLFFSCSSDKKTEKHISNCVINTIKNETSIRNIVLNGSILSERKEENKSKKVINISKSNNLSEFYILNPNEYKIDEFNYDITIVFLSKVLFYESENRVYFELTIRGNGYDTVSGFTLSYKDGKCSFVDEKVIVQT
jgi:hypothetical protein